MRALSGRAWLIVALLWLVAPGLFLAASVDALPLAIVGLVMFGLGRGS